MSANSVVKFQAPQAVVPSFSMSDMQTIAETIARGGMFGSKDPYAVLTLCLVAQAEGKHPAIVFRDYDLIQGKPAKKAQAMQTDFLAAGGKIEWHALDDTQADATFSHPAGGSARISWDMSRAATAGLASKDMWRKFPRQMLRSRTISEGVRTVFPGATSGLYETSEVQDMTPAIEHNPTPAKVAEQAIDNIKPAGPDKAAEWTREHLEAIADAADLDDLATIEQAGAKAMAKLARDRPELHLECLHALANRREALAFEPDAFNADDPIA